MKQKRLDPEIEGPLIISCDIFEDERGHFLESFNSEEFQSHGLPTLFPQDNQARSLPGVLRGLHFQQSPTQGKLVSVIEGQIFDVIVDLRKNSTTFLKFATLEMDGKIHGQALWIPKGFAHGYCVRGRSPATVLYKVDELYNSSTQSGIKWNDDDLNIPWPVKNPILSNQDQRLPTLKTFLKEIMR